MKLDTWELIELENVLVEEIVREQNKADEFSTMGFEEEFWPYNINMRISLIKEIKNKITKEYHKQAKLEDYQRNELMKE